jgi:hypothetical protein
MVYFKEQVWFETKGGKILYWTDGEFANGHITIPESLAPTLVKQFHEGTHTQGKQVSRPPWPNILCSQALWHM